MADSVLAPHQLYAYEPPVSLWELIKSYVPEHELQEVKNILGESLVEQSIELHQEVETLLEIWRDYRNETENNLMYHRLPEPPAARERLKQEIKFFVDSLREKSEHIFTTILSKHNKSVLDYVLNSKEPDTATVGRPSSATSSRDGRETPVVVSSPDRLSRVCAVNEEVDSLKNNLNFLQLDNVVDHLRQTLAEEVEWLLKDTEFLQKCLEDESNLRVNPMMSREPSLADLREERTKLEKDLLADDLPQALKDVNITMKRQTSVAATGKKPAGHPRTPPGGKLGPMKAFHHICTKTSDKPCTSESCDKHNTVRSPTIKPLAKEANRGGSPFSGTSSSSPGDEGEEFGLLPAHRHFTETPTHVTIRTRSLNNSKVVKVGSVALNHAGIPLHTPSPPSSSKPRSGRPGSAQRFRQMILECREGD